MPLTIKHNVLKRDGTVEEMTITPRKAIRLKCLDCCCFQENEVRECSSTLCPLWPYRMGRGDPEIPTATGATP